MWHVTAYVATVDIENPKVFYQVPLVMLISHGHIGVNPPGHIDPQCLLFFSVVIKITTRQLQIPGLFKLPNLQNTNCANYLIDNTPLFHVPFLI